MENLNVVELKQDELRKIEGGWIRVGIGLLIAAGAAIINDWDNFKRGLAGEPELVK